MIYVDTVNIWYSPSIKKWNVCTLQPVPTLTAMRVTALVERERFQFDTFVEAINYINENLKGAENNDRIDAKSN